MIKIDDWQFQLSEFFREAMERPFDFPNWNCLFFAADAIKAQTGEDVIAKFRGTFKTETGAAKKMRQLYNVKTSQDLLMQALGEPLKSVAFARTGDIVFASGSIDFDLPTDTKLFGPVPGVCYGQQSYFVGEDGLIKVETLSLGSALWVSSSKA